MAMAPKGHGGGVAKPKAKSKARAKGKAKAQARAAARGKAKAKAVALAAREAREFAPAARAPMEAWRVCDVFEWLQSNDMSGPAAALQSQGVNGEDLVGFNTAIEFSRSVGLSLFAAQKVLRFRDQRLAEA